MEEVFGKFQNVTDVFHNVKGQFESRDRTLSDEEFNTLLEKLKEAH